MANTQHSQQNANNANHPTPKKTVAFKEPLIEGPLQSTPQGDGNQMPEAPRSAISELWQQSQSGAQGGQQMYNTQGANGSKHPKIYDREKDRDQLQKYFGRSVGQNLSQAVRLPDFVPGCPYPYQMSNESKDTQRLCAWLVSDSMAGKQVPPQTQQTLASTTAEQVVAVPPERDAAQAARVARNREKRLRRHRKRASRRASELVAAEASAGGDSSTQEAQGVAEEVSATQEAQGDVPKVPATQAVVDTAPSDPATAPAAGTALGAYLGTLSTPPRIVEIVRDCTCRIEPSNNRKPRRAFPLYVLHVALRQADGGVQDPLQASLDELDPEHLAVRRVEMTYELMRIFQHHLYAYCKVDYLDEPEEVRQHFERLAALDEPMFRAVNDDWDHELEEGPFCGKLCSCGAYQANMSATAGLYWNSQSGDAEE
jgi:hypothetical protein